MDKYGFTLIEIIAILILLAILATMAIPKSTALKTETQNKVAQTAVTAARQYLQQLYHEKLLSAPTSSTAWSNTIANIPENCGVDDQSFTVTCTETGDLISITATGNSGSPVSGGTASGNFTHPES